MFQTTNQTLCFSKTFPLHLPRSTSPPPRHRRGWRFRRRGRLWLKTQGSHEILADRKGGTCGTTLRQRGMMRWEGMYVCVYMYIYSYNYITMYIYIYIYHTYMFEGFL